MILSVTGQYRNDDPWFKPASLEISDKLWLPILTPQMQLSDWFQRTGSDIIGFGGEMAEWLKATVC